MERLWEYEMGSMIKHTLLAAVLAGLSLLEPSCGAAQTRLRRVISLSGETVRIPASEVIQNFTTSTSYGIDYLEYFPPNRSFADRAAQVQSTLGGLCHVGRIPGTRFEIAQSCPAPKIGTTELRHGGISLTVREEPRYLRGLRCM
jgi:hypothetical protein